MGAPGCSQCQERMGTHWRIPFLKYNQLVGRGSQKQSSSYKRKQASNNTPCKQPGGEIPHIPGAPGWEILWLDFGVLLDEAELLQWQKFLLFPKNLGLGGRVWSPCQAAEQGILEPRFPLFPEVAALWGTENPGKGQAGSLLPHLEPATAALPHPSAVLGSLGAPGPWAVQAPRAGLTPRPVLELPQ